MSMRIFFALALCVATPALAQSPASSSTSFVPAAMSNQAIADELAAALAKGGDAYTAALGRYWSAEGVRLAHEPPLPMDGIWTREQSEQSANARNLAFRRAFPDFHYADIEARVVGNVIYLLSVQTGTRADGVTVATPLASRFTIDKGRIVAVTLGIDPATMGPLVEAMAAPAK